MKKRFFWLFLLGVFLVPVLLPFFRPGFFVTDDGEWMIIRLSDFHRSLVDGQIPPRWAGRLNHGFGYPVFNFLYPGMLYFGEVFHLLGLGFVDSVKALFVASFIFSALFTFFWIQEIFKKNLEALVAALFFILSPYHLFDVFRRGSLGEVTALTFVPLFFFAVEKNLLWLQALSFGLMILSHNIIAFLFLPVFILYFFLRKKEKNLSSRQFTFSFLVGLGVAAFFWIPALFELKFTHFAQVKISNPQAYFLTSKTISLIGMGGVFVFFLNLPFLIKKKPKLDFLFSIILLGGIFFSLSFSKLFWQLPLFSKLVQFPFRFLSLTLPAASYLAASFLSRFQKLKKLIIGFSLFASVFYLSYPYLIPREYINKGEGFYTTNESTTTVANEYLPVWVKVKPCQRAKEKVEIVKGKAKVKNLFFNSRKTSFEIEAREETIIQVNTIYYPGWQLFVNGKKRKIDYQNERGLITFKLPRGKSQVLIEFKETLLRLFSDIISFASFVFIIYLIFQEKRLERQWFKKQ